MRLRTRTQRGFSLVELLTVIGVLTILAALLLPTLEHALDQGRRMACMNNLRQISIMADMYANDSREVYPYKLNISVSFVPQAFPRTYLAPYGYDAALGQCPGGRRESNPAFGHYLYQAGGISPIITSGAAVWSQKIAVCTLWRSNIVRPDRWAIAGDILIGGMNGTPPGGGANAISYGTLWSDSHIGGMNMATAAGNVRWYPSDQCNGVAQQNPWGAVHPREMLYPNWTCVYNNVNAAGIAADYYWQDYNGTTYDLYSNVDRALIYLRWGKR